MRFPRIFILILSLCMALTGAGVTLALASGRHAAAIPDATCSVPNQYATLQAALNDTTCDTIQVMTGTYTANLAITRSLTIQGVAADLVHIQGAGTGPVISTDPNTIVTLQGLTISGGSGGAQNGGGILNQGNLFIQDILIENNTTMASGGGIANIGMLTMVDSALRSNQAGITAGALFLGKDSKSTLANVTISGNRAVFGGGAIADEGLRTPAAAISNTTIVQNVSQTGAGGIDLATAQVSLANTILAQNNNLSGLSNYHNSNQGVLISQGHNLEDGNDAGLTASGDIQNANPLLLPLALNGGSTPSHALILGSPAIDSGDSTICSQDPVSGLDQRGVSRNQGAACDIGAYEYDMIPLQKSGPARSPAGEVTTYTLTIPGVNPYITALNIEDALPAGLVFNNQLNASIGNASYDSAQKKVLWSNGSFSIAEGGSGATLPAGSYGYALAQCSERPNQIYLFGGFDNSGNPTDQALRYDAAQDVWTHLANIPNALANANAACYEGKVYLLGGSDGSNVLNQMNIYDVAANSWRTILQGLPSPRMGAALGLWQGKLYLAGGTTSQTPSHTVTDTLNIYDITNDIWSRGNALPQRVTLSGYSQAGSELFLAGGWSSLNPTVTLSSTLRLNLDTGNWSVGPSLPAQRADFALFASNTSLYAFGGVDASGALTSTVISLDQTAWPSGSWTGSPPELSASKRSFLAACTPVDGGRVWYPGGFDTSAINSNPYRPVYEGCPAQFTQNVRITFQAKLDENTGQAITNTASLTADSATFSATTRTFIIPEVSVGDVSLPEGASGTTTPFNFPVSLSAADEQTDYVALSTQDGTATLADHDYRPRYQVLEIPPGTTLVTFTVTVNGDDRLEQNEIFYVNLAQSGDLVEKKPTGVGTILNDDYGAYMPIFFR